MSYIFVCVFYCIFVCLDYNIIMVDDFLLVFLIFEEVELCFNVFDKDFNGDILMEEFEMVCNEIYLEKKVIVVFLKDLDFVIKKLDEVFMFFVVVIVIIVFISIIFNLVVVVFILMGMVILGLLWFF